MELWIGLDPEQFAARAGDFLDAEPERTVLATVLEGTRTGRYPTAVFAVASDPAGATVGVALRTPPQHMLAAGAIEEPDAFLEAWLGLDPAVTGVSADPALAGPLADAWSARTGGLVELHRREALHALVRVTPAERETPGTLRIADWRESAQLTEWGVAFGSEAGVIAPDEAGAGVAFQLEQGRLYVWERDGEVVSLIGHSVAVSDSVRIGPVYTPPALRGHGYATAATAALSQQLLDRGAERCLLYTDLANPISNHIYAKVGYVRVADWEERSFRPAPVPDGG